MNIGEIDDDKETYVDRWAAMANDTDCLRLCVAALYQMCRCVCV